MGDESRTRVFCFGDFPTGWEGDHDPIEEVIGKYHFCLHDISAAGSVREQVQTCAISMGLKMGEHVGLIVSDNAPFMALMIVTVTVATGRQPVIVITDLNSTVVEVVDIQGEEEAFVARLDATDPFEPELGASAEPPSGNEWFPDDPEELHERQPFVYPEDEIPEELLELTGKGGCFTSCPDAV